MAFLIIFNLIVVVIITPLQISYMANNCFAVPYNVSFNNQSFVSTCPNIPRNSNFQKILNLYRG